MPRRFKFNAALFAKNGKVQEIRVPKRDGTKIVITAPNPNVGIPPGHIMQIGDDDRALRVLRADPRFTDLGPA